MWGLFSVFCFWGFQPVSAQAKACGYIWLCHLLTAYGSLFLTSQR